MLEGVVQVDESYFGKRRSKQPQHIVVGAKDTATGRIALRITDSRDRQPLEQFVQDYIVAGSLVASDKWWAYDELELLGYAHESWNHSKGRFAGYQPRREYLERDEAACSEAVRRKNPDETARLSLPRMDSKS